MRTACLIAEYSICHTAFALVDAKSEDNAAANTLKRNLEARESELQEELDAEKARASSLEAQVGELKAQIATVRSSCSASARLLVCPLGKTVTRAHSTSARDLIRNYSYPLNCFIVCWKSYVPRK